MKRTPMLKYLAFALVLYGLFIGSQFLIESLLKLYRMTYQGGRTVWCVMMLTSMLIGVLLGMENPWGTVSEKKGYWKINWQRFLIIGIPALVIIINFIIYLFGIPSFLLKFSIGNIITRSEFVMMNSLILGYTLSSSFYRDESSR